MVEGRGYDPAALTNVYTADHAWARLVIAEVARTVSDVHRMRALGFCVSVDHARWMADRFNEAGIRSVAVSGDTAAEIRRRSLLDLASGNVSVVFAVDLFNEGIDVPDVDTLLMLRPTESGTLFLQQLGRGCARQPGWVWQTLARTTPLSLPPWPNCPKVLAGALTVGSSQAGTAGVRRRSRFKIR